MRKHPVISSVLLLGLFLGVLTPQFAQDVVTNPPSPHPERHAFAVSLLRTINTAEVVELYKYDSYPSWETLLAHNAELYYGLPRNYPQKPKLRHVDMPRI